MLFLFVGTSAGTAIINCFWPALRRSNVIAARKLFHFLAFFLFAIGLYYTPKLMRMAFCGFVWLFWLAELVRQHFSSKFVAVGNFNRWIL
jgi:hypothetical protein